MACELLSTPAYPSYINVVNTGGPIVDATRVIRDAVSGNVFGTYTLAALKGRELVRRRRWRSRRISPLVRLLCTIL